ncbi:MAG: hypothetical protein ABIR94_08135 [Rubrivivax sp.]
MNALRQSHRLSVVAVWASLLALTACGGNPSGLQDAPVHGATELAAATSGAARLSAEPEAIASDRAPVVARSTDHRPETPQPAGCEQQPDQLAGVDGGRAVEDAPDPGDGTAEPVPADREVAREAG